MHIRTTKELFQTNSLPDMMPKVTLGRSGLEVSVIGWGAPGISGDPGHMENIWQTFRSRGGNFLDTAPSYAASEDLIGEHLRGHREEFVLATKSHPVSADQTLRDVENSLKRMQTDSIDLLYAPHGCRNEEQLANILRKGGVIEGALKAKQRGLAKKLAFSFDYFQEMDIRRLQELIAADVFDVVQLPYGLVQVEPVDEEIIPYARDKGMGIIANFPTISGLTGREWGVFYQDFEGIVDTPGQASLLAVLCNPDVHCVLTRFSSVARAEENCFSGRRYAAMKDEETQELRRRVTAKGSVRCLQQSACPAAPPGLAFRRGIIYFDLFTRFGFGGARPVVESFVGELQEHAGFDWDESTRTMVEDVLRACPVMLT